MRISEGKWSVIMDTIDENTDLIFCYPDKMEYRIPAKSIESYDVIDGEVVSIEYSSEFRGKIQYRDLSLDEVRLIIQECPTI